MSYIESFTSTIDFGSFKASILYMYNSVFLGFAQVLFFCEKRLPASHIVTLVSWLCHCYIYTQVINDSYFAMIVDIPWPYTEDYRWCNISSKLVRIKAHSVRTYTLCDVLIHVVQLCHTGDSVLLKHKIQYHHSNVGKAHVCQLYQ